MKTEINRRKGKIVDEVTYECDRCAGTGYVKVEPDEFHAFLSQKIEELKPEKEGDSFAPAYDFIAEALVQYQENGKIECQDCNGAGTWVQPE